MMEKILGKFGSLVLAGILVALGSLCGLALIKTGIGNLPSSLTTFFQFGLGVGVVMVAFAVGFIWRYRA